MGDSDDLNPIPGVTVVVVSFNTQDHLRRCLASLGPGIPIVVVDNASDDGSPEMVRREFPHVQLIALDCNVGFGAANNLGIARATTPLILLLNSDAEARPGSIRCLADVFVQFPDAVAAGGRLEFPDGRMQMSSSGPLTLWAVFCEQLFIEPALRWFGLPGYWNSHRYRTTTPVTQVMGACLMMKPIERFNPDYFLYCEDTDLCHRLKRHGNIFYCPEAVFTHALGGSSPSVSRWLSVARYNAGKELYFRLHHGRIAASICWVLNRLGALIRLAIWLVLTLVTLGSIDAFRRKLVIFARVLTAPVAGPKRPECSDQEHHQENLLPRSDHF